MLCPGADMGWLAEAVLLWFCVCPDGHLQVRSNKEAAACAAHPCRLLVCQPFPWVCVGRATAISRSGASTCSGAMSSKADGKEERSSHVPCFPVLPSPAGPCSLGCSSASHFHGPVLKGPLQSVGLVPAPAVGPGLSNPGQNFGFAARGLWGDSRVP